MFILWKIVLMMIALLTVGGAISEESMAGKSTMVALFVASSTLLTMIFFIS